MQEAPVWFLGQKIPRRRDRLLIPVFLGFPGGLVGKESTCNAGDLGLIPGLEDHLEDDMANHPSILAWRIPWIEEPSGLQSMGRKESDMTEWLSTHKTILT